MENWPATAEKAATPAKLEPIAVRPDEAARALGLSPRTIDKLIRTGAIRSRTVGRARLVSVASLRRFMDEGGTDDGSKVE